MLELMCVSCKENKFKSKDGSEVCFYNVFLALDDGDIAKINSGKPIPAGTIVELVPAVKDGFLTLKVKP